MIVYNERQPNEQAAVVAKLPGQLMSLGEHLRLDDEVDAESHPDAQRIAAALSPQRFGGRDAQSSAFFSGPEME